MSKRGGGAKPAGKELSWFAKRIQAQEAWKQQLKGRGVHFAVGGGPCKERARSQCIGEWIKTDDCRSPSNRTGAAHGNWASWRVPDALRERGVDSGDPALYGPLLRKLDRGEPVTILALGSSVVGAHAGCTAAWPALKRCPCPKCCGSRCGRWGGGGWALRVLGEINATWPHAAHRLYNLGEPGGDLMPSILACPRSYLSFDPDVVLLDFFTSYHGGRDAAVYERVVRLLLTHRRAATAGARAAPTAAGDAAADAYAPPVLLFVNFFEFADRHHPTSTYSTMTSQLTAALREHRKAPRPASWPAVAAGRGEPDDVAALWHTDAASGVAEAAALIRTWARAARRKVESTDVYRNWWRDQELHALQTVT